MENSNSDMMPQKKVLLSPGDKVMFNLIKIWSNVNYKRFTVEYRRFIKDGKSRVFTVEYDKRHAENPSIVCLKEDKNDPKWLFPTDFFIKID